MKRLHLSWLAYAVMIRINPDPEALPNVIIRVNDAIAVTAMIGPVIHRQSLEAIVRLRTVWHQRAASKQLGAVLHAVLSRQVDPHETFHRGGVSPRDALFDAVAIDIEPN